MERTLKVEGMMCEHCVAHVTEALEGIEGVEAVKVDLEAGTAQVQAAEDVADDELVKAVTEAGYGAAIA